MVAYGLGSGWVDEHRTFWVNPGAAWEGRLQTLGQGCRSSANLQTMEHAETRSLLNESRTTPPPPASQIVISRLKRVSRTSRVFRLLASSEAAVLVGSLGQQNVPPLSKLCSLFSRRSNFAVSLLDSACRLGAAGSTGDVDVSCRCA